MSGNQYDPNSIDATLARIEARQIENRDKLQAVIDAHTERFEKMEGRLADVEKKQWWLSGAGAAVAFIASKLGK
jgi:hypothetical protein